MKYNTLLITFHTYSYIFIIMKFHPKNYVFWYLSKKIWIKPKLRHIKSATNIPHKVGVNGVAKHKKPCK